MVVNQTNDSFDFFPHTGWLGIMFYKRHGRLDSYRGLHYMKN